MDANNNSIVLIGFMGSGKTTVSKIIAQKLGLLRIDTDSEIERLYKMPIPQIFNKYGESYFRELERGVVQQIAEGARAVIATGGGVVKDSENVQCLKRCGTVFYLRASAATIVAHLGDDAGATRPLLADGADDPLAHVERLLAERAPLYEGSADVIIDIDGLYAADVAMAIISKIETKTGEQHENHGNSRA